MVVATGSSQFEVLSELAAQPSIPWERVTIFHLDEYVGLSPDHPAETLDLYAFMEAPDESRLQGGVPVDVATVMARAK